MKSIKESKFYFDLVLFIAASCAIKLTVGQHVISTKSPVVIYHQPGTSGKVDNFFGFSLAYLNDSRSFWRDSRQDFGSQRIYGTLFIGAPTETRLTKNSGVVWGCRFGANSELGCSLVSSISNQKTASESMRQCSNNVRFAEKEEDQWIGDNLSVKDGQLIACAPRWKWNNNNYPQRSCSQGTAMLGACYVAQFSEDAKLKAPLLHRPHHFTYDVMEANGERVSGYWLLYAQFGFSSHVTNLQSNQRLFVGSPSARSWTGNFAEYDYDANPNRALKFYNYQGEKREVKQSSYLGYSITSGKASSYSQFIAVGAPRAENLRGLVYMQDLTSSGEPTLIIGKQFGSYFGYAVSTADLDGDGKDELLVGAPWQTGSSNLRSDGNIYSTGCVFVYDITSVLNGRPSPETELCPDTQRGKSLTVSTGARFGAAIVNLGDINSDGYEDIAIGAPYDGDGIGSVFIFYGYIPFSNMPSQLIHGKSFGIPTLRGFGSYMVAGRTIDIDGNGVPDLAVGAYESGHVFMLRTRPVARASVRITFHTGNSRGTEGQIYKFPPTENELRMRTCVSLQFSIPRSQEKRLNIWLRFEADKILKRFVPEAEEKIYTLSDGGCVDQLFTAIKEVVEGSGDPDFNVALWYNETSEASNNSPVQRANLQLSPTQQTTTFSQDQSYKNAFSQFDAYLPAPFGTASRQSLEIAADNCNEDGDATCRPNLQLEVRLKYENTERQRKEYNLVDAKADRNPLIIGEVDRLILSINLGNIRETAYRPSITITMGVSDNVDLREIKSFLQSQWTYRAGRQKDCIHREVPQGNPQKAKFTLTCDKSLHSNAKMEYDWSLSDLRRLIVKGNNPLAKLDFIVEAFPEYDNQYKVEKRFSVPLQAQVKISASSTFAGEGTIDPKKNYVDFIQTILVKNSGFSATAMDSVRVEIMVPSYAQVKRNFTRVIGIANPASKSGSNLRCEGKFFDPALELQDYKAQEESPEDVQRNRTKRSSTGTGLKEPLKLQDEKETIFPSDDDVIILNGCNMPSGHKSCEKITCHTDLPSKSSREIRLRMYMLPGPQRDLIKDSHLGIRVDSVIAVFYMNTKEKTIMGRAERKFMHVVGIPAYIILLSIGGGTILFLLMTFALFKCGFFRRKTKEQLKQLKRQTMHMEVPQPIPGDGEDDTAF